MLRFARLATAFALGGALLCGPILESPLGNGRPALALESDDAGLASDSALRAAVALPSPLSAADAALYQGIFAAQRQNDFAGADRKIEALTSKLLLGHVLAQRYLATSDYRAGYQELADWLRNYADLPGAKQVYSLARGLKLEAEKAPAEALVEPSANPASQSGVVKRRPGSYASERERDEAEREQVAEIKDALGDAISDGSLDEAREMLESEPAASLLDGVESDQGLARLAAGHFFKGETKEAFALAHEAALRSGAAVPSAHWTAGLAAWKLGRYGQARDHFAAYAGAKPVSDWARAGGAFWAARSSERLKDEAGKLLWLMRAAERPHTFYGLVAGRQLGLEMPFDFAPAPLRASQAARLLESPEARRGFALLQAGEKERAKEEFLRVGGWAEPATAEALLAAAEAAGLPALSYRLAQRLRKLEERPEIAGLDRAFYPLPPWRPAEGFEVDRALIFAMMRKESRFDPEAVSPGGASGLMQIMPKTAAYLDGQDYSGAAAKALFDPKHNIALGQQYLARLLGSKSTGGDLFHLAAAYNSGPGNLGRWKSELGDLDDPLLFIESLPSLETRVFTEHVLASYWIYRARLGQDTGSLDSVARGNWPRYDPIDRPPFDVARNGAN